MLNPKKHIRVAVDIRDLQIAASGTRTFLEELIKEFNQTEKEFSFIYLDSPRKIYTGKNKWKKLVEQLNFFYWKQVLLPIKAYQNKCDIVFCSDFMVPWVHLNFKTIPVFHDAFFWEFPQHYNKWWLMLFRKLSVASAKRAHKVLTPTHYTKQKIASHTGIALSHILAIGEGPKVAQNPTPPAFSLRHPYLLHVGTMEKRKNLPMLIKAFKIVRDKGHNVQLVLAGKASNKQNLDDSLQIKETIRSTGLTDHVIITGYLSDNEIAYVYQQAFAYVFPSINEGFGIPVLEAFYYKTPLLIANNSCLPEVAGKGAFSFDPYDPESIAAAIIRLLENETLRNQLIENGTEQLKQYSWPKTALQLKEIFQQAAANLPLKQ